MAQPRGHSPMHPINAEGGTWQQDMSAEGDFAGCAVAEVPPDIRSGFIRKVYAILSVQLAVTFAIAFYMNLNLTPRWVAENTLFFYMASFGTLGLTLGVSCCCASAMRTFPTNYIFLGAITLGMATMVGFSTVMYTTDSVLLALATTTAVFFVLTAYACLTKTDFTGMGPYLFAGLMALSMFGFMMMLWSFFTGAPLMGTTMHKVYACGGVLLFVLYIIYDTQLIVGGTHKKHQFSVDDYAFAALNLYLDIVNLFMFLLELTGERR
eukprot:CAMPEP_0171088478 /NCGR_PEP_ID=MMETSP0766_2-20121228/20807_1 /TAXON_ID=439317 /ORGANISM="Gambierdiscus australes, Strain CAWD 149" /LENGTH=265 /DNA_ID=CAMNT_0011546281 /DNA_START=14 /DNA_END=811 /DNA_ORIENTATION=+